jgi:hypothetical protein
MGLFLTNDKISVDFMRAFLICFRFDNSSGKKFFFLPQSMVSHYPQFFLQIFIPDSKNASYPFFFLQVQESIEGGALEREFLQALDDRSKEAVRKSRLVSVFHVSVCMDVYVYGG